MIVRLALFAALAGSALGGAVVLADDRPPASPALAVPAVGTPVPPGAPTSSKLDVRDLRTVARVADPAGGAPWALRRFTGKYGTKDDPQLCSEIGRLVDGRFGWIDGHGTFRPLIAGRFGGYGSCTRPSELRRRGAVAGRFTTLTLPPGGAPQPRVTVTWAMADPRVRALVPRGEAALTLPDGGTLLDVRRPTGGFAPLTGRLEYRDGRRQPFNRITPPRFRGERPVGPEVVAARAPDPAGGAPWGFVAAKGSRGGVCLSYPDRLVGEHLGLIDSRLGIVYAAAFEWMRRCGGRPTRAYPLRIDTGIDGGGPEDPRGRIERRVETGRIVFYGRVHPDVVSVTIRTPRDVRTLVPSSRFHAILTVYEGRFPGGEVTATARMADGREVTRSLYVE